MTAHAATYTPVPTSAEKLLECDAQFDCMQVSSAIPHADCMIHFTAAKTQREQVQARPPMAVTNAVSWRSEGIRHKKNEVFLDVVESVNLLVNSNGAIVRSEVTGALKMRTALSGMPECKLGLNDKVRLPASVQLFDQQRRNLQ